MQAFYKEKSKLLMESLFEKFDVKAFRNSYFCLPQTWKWTPTVLSRGQKSLDRVERMKKMRIIALTAFRVTVGWEKIRAITSETDGVSERNGPKSIGHSYFHCSESMFNEEVFKRTKLWKIELMQLIFQMLKQELNTIFANAEHFVVYFY